MATVADGEVRANAEPVLTDEQIATYRRDGLVKVDVRKILGDEAFERMRIYYESEWGREGKRNLNGEYRIPQ